MINIENIVGKVEEEKSFNIVKEVDETFINTLLSFMDSIFVFLVERDGKDKANEIIQKIDKRYKIEGTESSIYFVSVV